MAEENKPNKQEKIGHVVSAGMRKTIVVAVVRKVPHPLYKRIVTKKKKFYAHDEQGTAQVGDVVRIVECRPLSRLKRWNLAEVIRKAVKGMLPRNKLARKQLLKLKIYAGAEHPHAAQQPKPLEVK